MKELPWVRIGKLRSGGFGVTVYAGSSIFSNVIEEIPCSCREAAEKTKSEILKQLGYTFGGRQ